MLPKLQYAICLIVYWRSKRCFSSLFCLGAIVLDRIFACIILRIKNVLLDTKNARNKTLVSFSLLILHIKHYFIILHIWASYIFQQLVLITYYIYDKKYLVLHVFHSYPSKIIYNSLVFINYIITHF